MARPRLEICEMNGNRELYRRSSAGQWYRSEISEPRRLSEAVRRVRIAIVLCRGYALGL
jgi:hypothetical protein